LEPFILTADYILYRAGLVVGQGHISVKIKKEEKALSGCKPHFKFIVTLIF
jgi:hypothetical protein